MAFSLGDGDNNGMTEINLIPLIDIMLVLMIIFLVTATVANPSIPLTLPKTSAEVQPLEPKVVTISINANNDIAWNGEVVSLTELEELLKQESLAEKKPSLHLQADKDSKYDTTAQVLSRASTAGLSDISFVSESSK